MIEKPKARAEADFEDTKTPEEIEEAATEILQEMEDELMGKLSTYESFAVLGRGLLAAGLSTTAGHHMINMLHSIASTPLESPTSTALIAAGVATLAAGLLSVSSVMSGRIKEKLSKITGVTQTK